MSFWAPLGGPPPVGQGNAPPAIPPNAPNPGVQANFAPQAPAAGFNALGLQGFQGPAAANNQANNALGQNTLNPGPQPPAGNPANNGLAFNPFNPVPQPLASFFGTNNPNQGGPPPQAGNNDFDDDSSLEDSDDEDPANREPEIDQEEDLSPINLRITCPIKIDGSNNIVAIDAAKIAHQIAKAMVKTLQDMAAGCSGVPMIDQDGRPRPVECRVDCKVKVNGNKNVVGEKAVIAIIPREVRKSMIEGMLPVTPLSPTEDTLMEEIIKRKRYAIARGEARKEEEEARAKGNEDEPKTPGKRGFNE